MKITVEQIEAAYDLGKRAFAGKLTPDHAAEWLSDQLGMNRNSAKHLIDDYRLLRHGIGYTRTLSLPAAKRFLVGIYADEGREALATACKAIREHIDYYEGKRNIKLPSLRALVAENETLANAKETLEEARVRFDQAVACALKDGVAARKARLETAQKLPARRTVTTEIFNRNPDVVAEVLDRAKGRCEVCGKPAPFARRRDGSPYLEVHHRVQLAQSGEDTPDNALATCPNCHRKAHFGPLDAG
jgi:5-methylcytosine-specific restriction protein A